MKFRILIPLFIIVLLNINCTKAQEKLRRNNSVPNFILVVADDLGYADLSLNGSMQIHTPNIDLLAEKGANFTQGYVSSAVCSPSRAGILTGKNQVEFGQDNNIDINQKGFDSNYLGLPIDQKTVANYLKELGYTTGLIGKWHLGEASQFHPLNRGFDEFWGYSGGGHDYFRAEPNGEGRMAPIECNYKEPSKITYITDDKGDECVNFISRHNKEPFFLFASFNAPHTPMQAREIDLELFKNIKDKERRTYAAMVHRLDLNIGKIVDALDKNGLTENTLIFFISDNGGPIDQNSSLNAPYRGQKGILLEGGIRVPYIMKWPKSIPANTVYKNPVSSLDIVPTILELAGGSIENKSLTGTNLIPYVAGKNTERPHDELKWRFTISSAIRLGDWKLVSIPDRLPMLYYLPDDPSELNNLSLEQIEKTKLMLKKLGNWKVSLPHPLFLEGAEWKRKQLDLYDVDYQLIQPPLKK